MAYPYDPTPSALFAPAEGARFFPHGRPAGHAALCAEMSRLAYAGFEHADGGDRARVEEALGHVGFQPLLLFSAAGTQGFLATDTRSSLSVLAFRGTEVDPGDWRTDLNALRKPWPGGGEVHEGFLGALEAVWDQIGPHLAEAPGRRVYTGHSLGAALATLAAARQPPDTLCTFGSPRVGDEAFVRALPRFEIHRYSNCCDLVCCLPLEVLGYRHLGPLSYLDRRGRLHEDPPGGLVWRDQWMARAGYAARYGWQVWRNLPTRDLADHAPVNYFSALSQLRQGP
jgi:Lipase (class 3)